MSIRSARTDEMTGRMRSYFLLAVLNLAHPFFFDRHYDAGGYEDDENEEDMENDDEFGSDAERGKLCRALSWTQVLIVSSLLDNSRGPWA